MKLATKHSKKALQLDKCEQITTNLWKSYGEKWFMKTDWNKFRLVFTNLKTMRERVQFCSQNWFDLKQIRNDFERKNKVKKNNILQKWRGEGARLVIRDRDSWCKSWEIKSGNWTVYGSNDGFLKQNCNGGEFLYGRFIISPHQHNFLECASLSVKWFHIIEKSFGYFRKDIE